ncbi:3-oxoacyl-[acyl-carrier protein] reductase [Arcticibacter tournemirensis]|uniref:3-ketoacyl-ACP reductase n=1 Tax=Arcticibacter tournemirensis TaxID=699437 RepID=A0A5M9HIE9_9SPHI|nr:3-ketoacyl-ACP reductase [Arcticibacter tournemirensis]KAA8486279.1 3-ketoacyl-ACP reductase [Arcticibacter tournemirensis]TQM52084.1 3-oxoacyl-[acyl-carrier protein] reductase [Arcticibacter tournemirensis]
MQILKGKTAIITGAGKGLGRAMALALAAEGVNLGLVARTVADLERVAGEAKGQNPDITVALASADVANYAEVQSAVGELVGKLEKVDILVNNAGILKVGGFLELPVTEWEEVFRVNVLGNYYVIHEVLPFILEQGRGDIINVASTAGLKGSARMSAYGASKAAVINLTESLMQEVRKSNIRVTTVNPSTIATEMTINANFTDGNAEKVLQPEDLASLVVNNLKLPQRAFVKEVGLWSTNP